MSARPYLQRHEPSPWRLMAVVLAFATLAAVLALMVTAPTPPTYTPTRNVNTQES